MHVITRKRLQEFWHTHPDSERPLKAWLAIVRLKSYSGPHEVRQDFATQVSLGNSVRFSTLEGTNIALSLICAMTWAGSMSDICLLMKSTTAEHGTAVCKERPTTETVKEM
jgi:mRNA-degrading endonuclease HigB of HigAB toxin-antitoxin module